MSDRPALRKLTEHVLRDGDSLPLALLLEQVVPVRRLRELARKFGLTPKGGFRIEKAPANVLAPLLAELRAAEQLEDVLALLLPAPAAAAKEVPAPTPDQSALLALRDEEIARLRAEVERARQGGLRAQEREAELQRRHQVLEQELLVARRQPVALPALSAAVELAPGERDLQRKLRELEVEYEELQAADEALRRQQANDRTRIRELERDNAELSALLPKGKRKQRAAPPPPAEARRFRLPHFTPAFYKSLVGKDRKAVERAVQAVLLFCTEGHAYPGLEVKQLGGQDTWSLRASLGLRVYFRQIEDGDIEVLELADREDQHTTLRRLKERQ